MPNPTKKDEEVIIIRLKKPEKDLKMIVTLVYVLQAVGFFLGFTWIAGVIINYIKRKEVVGTWLDTHFLWQIRTFWYGLLWTVIGTLLVPVLIGYIVLGISLVWAIYRIVKGWMYLSENKAMYINY